MNGSLRAGAAMIALLAGLSLAVAQQAPQAQPGQPSPQPPAKQEAGIPVPAAPGNTADTAALLNGRLAAPGAPQDSQTVPSTVSERNAALDKMPMLQPR